MQALPKKRKYRSLYREADKFFTFNEDDPDLTPVTLTLPESPQWKYIDGYGLHPDEQYFRRLEIPEKLQDLERLALDNLDGITPGFKKQTITRYKIIEEFWRLIDEKQDDLVPEIEYIKKIHWFLRWGYWFFCDGKPTWITPWHFQFLNFWHMPEVSGNYPDYRDVDRRSAYVKWYSYTTTETFKETNKKGLAVANEDGGYEMIDIGYRTCFGNIKPKRRREGASNQACNENLWIASRFKKGHADILAETGGGSEKIWKEIFLPAWDKWPVFLEPVNNSSSNPSHVDFIPPLNVFKRDSLMSRVGFTETASERANDKRRLISILCDEEGKTDPSYADVRKRWEVTKLTLAQGEKIHGYCTHPSTVEDMNAGGYIYEELWNQSNFYIRMPRGQTVSGLIRLFTHSWDGMDGYIDRWGKSVVDTPTERQIKLAPPGALFAIYKMGAKESLAKDLDYLLEQNTPSSLITYRERIRKHPRYSADCWIGITGDLGWDVIPIDRRMAELKRMKTTRRYNMEFINNDFKQGVRLIPDDHNGRFVISEPFLNKDPSIPTFEGGHIHDINTGQDVPFFMPHMPIGCVGADPFKWGNKTEAKLNRGGSHLSDGGGAGYWDYDSLVDSDNPPNKQQSGRIIFTYQNRTDQYTYFNDIMMAAVYFNMVILVETNISDMLPYYLRNGWWGYLLRLPDPLTGKLKDKPGFYTQSNKTDLFAAIKEYNEKTIDREMHPELLQDMKDIKSPDQMFKYDRLTAVGLALYGAKNMHYLKPIHEIDTSNLDIDLSGSPFAMRDY